MDASVGKLVSELKSRGLFDSTLIVITAKHGQSPIDPKRFFPILGHSGTNGNSPATIVDGLGLLPSSESPSNPTGIGPTEDDISLIWLIDSSKTGEAVDAIDAAGDSAGLGEIFYGPSITTMFNAPGTTSGDPRTPDIIVSPRYGVVYTGSSKKQAEHGGFSHDDTNVILLISNPMLNQKKVSAPVETMQVAPTILKALRLDPRSLQSVRKEGTAVLPEVQFDSDSH